MQEILAMLNRSHHEAYDSYKEFESRMGQLSGLVNIHSAANKK